MWQFRIIKTLNKKSFDRKKREGAKSKIRCLQKFFTLFTNVCVGWPYPWGRGSPCCC